MLAYEIPPEFRGGVHSLSVHIMYYKCRSAYIYGSKYDVVEVPVYRHHVSRPKTTGKLGKPVNRYTGISFYRLIPLNRVKCPHMRSKSRVVHDVLYK